MKRTMQSVFVVIALLLFSAGWAAADPSVTLKPTYAQRNFKDGSGSKEKTRIDIILSGAGNMLTFGVKIKVDPDYFTITDYRINDTAWNYVQKGYYKDFDGDGKEELGLFGASSTPQSGTVVLGWIVVQHVGGLANAPVEKTVTATLAKTGGAFQQFVNSAGAVLDAGTDFSGASTSICVVNFYDVDACQGDFNGDHVVDGSDQSRFSAAYGSAYPVSNYDPACDFNADGQVDDTDKTVFDADYARTTLCPVCGGHTITVIHDTSELTWGTIVPAPFEGWVGVPGKFSVADGTDYPFTFAPNPNYSVKDVKLDGASIYGSLTRPGTNSGADRAYSLTNVTADHTIEVHYINCPGDINGDGARGIPDYTLLKAAYGSASGGANWNPRADINQDGTVGIPDYTLFKANYGTSCP